MSDQELTKNSIKIEGIALKLYTNCYTTTVLIYQTLIACIIRNIIFDSQD